MDLTMSCKVSLSKRLRALVGKEGTITLVTSGLVDGKGIGSLSLSSDGTDVASTFDPIGIETAIMITPIEATDEVPNSDTISHASIFSTVPEKGQEGSVVKKIAVVSPPEKGQEARAIKEKVLTPQAFSQLDEPECREFICDFEELIEAVGVARQKQSTINLENAKDDREYAVLKEQKDKEEAIDIPAWIVNDKTGALSINDLDINLLMNSPFDLSRIPARKIASSKDLKSLLKSGYVKFVSPKERETYISKAVEAEKVPELDVFDNHMRAKANMSNIVDTTINEEDSLTVTEGDIDNPSDEESMITNLTQDMPVVKSSASSAATSSSASSSKTIHSNRAPQSSVPNNPAIKMVRKIN